MSCRTLRYVSSRRRSAARLDRRPTGREGKDALLRPLPPIPVAHRPVAARLGAAGMGGERADDEELVLFCLADEEDEEVGGRRIGPLQVFDDEDQRRAAS